MGPELLARLVSEHAAALVLFARQHCATPDDVVQEAFVRLATTIVSPRDPAAWLFHVVRNLAVSASRKERRRRHHESAGARTREPWFHPDPAAALDAEAVAGALERLPLEEREAIIAHLWGGLSFAEISHVCGTSASTVHRRYLNGLSRLRERYGVTCPAKTDPPS